ncbi:MAG: hypothetical protein LBR97_01640 [Dysgonamonadaceae bacterium]|jgi:virginiamycin A acetyltransferase|nr:hypothetical protein [Dysgonamonadaceae bacterium]
MNTVPDPNAIFPVPNINTVTYIKPMLKNLNIIVGDFTYFSGVNFEKQVTHHYDFYGDKLIIEMKSVVGSDVPPYNQINQNIK